MLTRVGVLALLGISAIAVPACASSSDVDVTNPQWAKSCPNAADPSGSLDSLCAILAALTSIETTTPHGASYPALYFPRGHYMIGVGVTGPGTLIYVNKAVSFKGDGPAMSILVNESPAASTLVLDTASTCNGGVDDECPLTISGLRLQNGGHASTGDGIESINTAFVFLRDTMIANVGGIALSLSGSSERWVTENLTIANANASIREVGDTNENNFTRVNVINPGFDEGNYCYSSPVCVNHWLPPVGATWYPSPRPTVYLDGVKNSFRDASMKSLQVDSGIRLPGELGQVENIYFEGGPWGGQPRLNAAIYAGGKMELSHTTTAMTATSTTVGVDDAMFQPGYVNNPADVQKFWGHANADQFCIYPQDYLYQASTASLAVPGISRGTVECVAIYGFAGDGNLYIRQRGQQPIAWPVGSIVEQMPHAGFGNASIKHNHLNSVTSLNAGYSAQSFLDGCDDYARRANWIGNPSQACASVFVGYVPDGYALPYPSTNYYSGLAWGATLEDNTTFTGGPEVDGMGYVKVMENGYVTIYGDGPLTQMPNLDRMQATYQNGSTLVSFAKYGSIWSEGSISDPGAHVTSIPQWGFFQAEVPQFGQGLVRVSTGQTCNGNLVSGSIPTTSLSCTQPNGTVVKYANQSGTWTQQ